MGSLTEDLLSTGFMNLSIKYFSSSNQVKKAKRRKYKIIATMFPVLNEVIFSTKSIPLFLPRLPISKDEYMDVSRLLGGTKLAEDILGKNLLSKSLGMASKVVSLDSIIIKQLDQVYFNYKKYVDICEQSNQYYIPCFGTKLFYGAILTHSDTVIDANLSFGTRCCSLNKSFELISKIVPKDLFIDLPNCETENPHSLTYVYEQIQEFVNDLESFAGPIDEDKIVQYTELINNIKSQYLEFYKFFKRNDYLPMRPVSFQHLFSLINLSYVDLISAPNYLFKNLKLLIQELKERVNNGNGYECSNSLKLLLLPSFGGYDGELSNFAAENDAYVFYSDWWFWRMLDYVDPKGDWIKNQAKFCIGVEKSWSSSKAIIDQWIKMIKDLNFDGIIFNDIVGCNAISGAEFQLKSELQKIGIPMITTNFQNIGLNLEQLKNRISALIEIIKNNK
ncbi:MAG: 2-hydroxyacyl-CoA dehydratase [Candidatus Helarchaeota archaeon]